MSIPRDVQEFLEGYPDVVDDPEAKMNYLFYSNRIKCQPDGRTVDDIHDRWFGKYNKLEYKHGYIQWLFPIREYGMNYESQPLQTHEISLMKADPTIVARIIESYKLMLDFFGMKLLDEQTGLLGRSDHEFEARYLNLVRSPHNYLRISRILKCLSELGLEHLNAGFLLHVLNEQSENGELYTRGVCNSMDRWWANCLRDEEERRWIGGLVRKVREGQSDEEGFVFTRKDYEKALERRKEVGSLGYDDEDGEEVEEETEHDEAEEEQEEQEKQRQTEQDGAAEKVDVEE